MALISGARAEIIYSGAKYLTYWPYENVNTVTSAAFGWGNVYGLTVDIDSDGSPDLKFFNNRTDPSMPWISAQTVWPTGDTSYHGPEGSEFATSVLFNTVIGPNLSGGTKYWNSNYYGKLSAPSGTRYLGIRKGVPGAYRYGWVEVIPYFSSTPVILGWAYETELNKPIPAGATKSDTRPTSGVIYSGVKNISFNATQYHSDSPWDLAAGFGIYIDGDGNNDVSFSNYKNPDIPEPFGGPRRTIVSGISSSIKVGGNSGWSGAMLFEKGGLIARDTLNDYGSLESPTPWAGDYYILPDFDVDEGYIAIRIYRNFTFFYAWLRFSRVGEIFTIHSWASEAQALHPIVVGSVKSLYQPAHINRDLNGDYSADVVEVAPDGNVYASLLDLNNIVARYRIGSVDSTWKLCGRGDLNGDEISDLVWFQKVSGNVYVWEMAKDLKKTIKRLGKLPPGITPAGIADLNTDFVPELVTYRPATGLITTYNIQEGVLSGTSSYGQLALSDKLLGVVVKENGSPHFIIEDVNGATYYASVTTAAVVKSPLGFEGFKIEDIADYTEDGIGDYLIRRNSNGELLISVEAGYLSNQHHLVPVK